MKYFIGLFCIAIFFSCQPNTHVTYSISKIIKVELARSGAWSDIGAAMSVDSSLEYRYLYNYIGPNEEKLSRYYTGKISRQFWDTLNRKLESIDYGTVDSTDNLSGSDINYFELIVRSTTGKRRIVRMKKYNQADSLGNFIDWLDNSHKHIHLTQVDKLPKFETTYQANGFEEDQMKYFHSQRELRSKSRNAK